MKDIKVRSMFLHPSITKKKFTNNEKAFAFQDRWNIHRNSKFESENAFMNEKDCC